MQKIAKTTFIAVFFIFIFGLFSGEIRDPDFWWHLKTGEYIYQTKSLPLTDPFAYTSLPKDPVHPESKRIKFILTQYWAAQILMYKIFESFGFQGIIVLRALVLTLLIMLTYKAIRRQGTGTLLSILMLLPLAQILLSFQGERPQLFSFLFSFIIIFLLTGYINRNLNRQDNLTLKLKALLYLVPIPLIMLLWTNLHGGFILGLAVFSSYLFSETIKFYLKRPGQTLNPPSLKILYAVFILTVIISLANPNGYNVIPVLFEFEKGLYSKTITESMSPFLQIKLGFNQPELITFFILLACNILLFIVNFRRLNLTDIVLFSGLAIMSLSAARFIPFFAPVALINISCYGSTMLNKIKPSNKAKHLLRKIEVPVYICLTIAIVIILNNSNFFKKEVLRNKFPEGATKFLKENKISGNMFNPYVWGGYLIWRLHPDYKVFIDGRGLIEDIYFQSFDILQAKTQIFEGLPKWKSLLNAYKINFIITFSVDKFTGNLVPLVPALLNDPEWDLIYMDNISLIFLKKSPENENMKKRFGIPKEWAWNEVIVEATIKSKYSKKNINFYLTIGDAFLLKKDYRNAKATYLKALKIKPDNNELKGRLELLKAYGY